jgi:hypothetical protein
MIGSQTVTADKRVRASGGKEQNIHTNTGFKESRAPGVKGSRMKAEGIKKRLKVQGLRFRV